MSAANIALDNVGNSIPAKNFATSNSPSIQNSPLSLSNNERITSVSGGQSKDLINVGVQEQDTKESPQLADLNSIVDKVNQQIQYVQKSLHFSVHKSSGKIMVEVQDLHTGKTIKKVPPEQLLDLFGKIRSAIGALIDKEG